MSQSPSPQRIVLITPVQAVAERWGALSHQLAFQLTILPSGADADIDYDCNVLIWHDVIGVGGVPQQLKHKGYPVWLLDTERLPKKLGGRLPPGYQPADYYLVEPFNSDDLQSILAAW